MLNVESNQLCKMASFIQISTFFSCIIFMHLVVLDLTPNAFTQPKFLYYNCNNTANYTNPSTYNTNLNSILSSLSSNIDQYGYYNSSIGQVPDRVTAVALCRGDVELELCRACINDSISKLKQVCPGQKEAIGWYDNCMLRYTDQTIPFGTMVWGPGFRKWYNILVPDEYFDSFQKLWATLFSSLRDRAASGDARRKYATGDEHVQNYETVYSLVQCTPDLSESGCKKCVNACMELIPGCCNKSIGAAVYKPSCNLRYELGSFYNESSPSPSPSTSTPASPATSEPPPPPPPPTTSEPPPPPTTSEPPPLPTTSEPPPPPPPTTSEPSPPTTSEPSPPTTSEPPPLPTTSEPPPLPTTSEPPPTTSEPPPLPTTSEPPPPPSTTSEPPPPTTSEPQTQSPPLAAPAPSDNARIDYIITFSITSFVVLFVLFVIVVIYLRKKKQRKAMQNTDVDGISTLESLQYDFDAVKAATNNFSETNKLGQGGFGPVYKGIFSNGKEFAVKRLSNGSGQGEVEFKNEVLLMARLQHRNLVRLMGFCLERIERLLVYEFVINGSLDHFIFDTIKGPQLDWEKRYKIIGGIAKGLLYLHEDSRLRIIHRDLKAGNILLDAEMNAKIADFGMARCFVLDETRGITSKIAGTYGYMAPEVLQGHISVKSDVYSFGVLVLEIISGQKISKTFGDEENAESLLSYAWKMWREGTASKLIEPTMRYNSSSVRDIMRCIHIGLLCVQENVNNRPTMASVVVMLTSFSLALPVPTKPAFFMDSSGDSEMGMPQIEQQAPNLSVNEVSITELHGR